MLNDDEVTDQFIRTVASEVRGHDEEYEQTLHEREKSNPKYAFLSKDVSWIVILSWALHGNPLIRSIDAIGTIAR